MKWTKEKINLLKRLYSFLPNDEIGIIMDTTKSAIDHKTKRMGLNQNMKNKIIRRGLNGILNSYKTNIIRNFGYIYKKRIKLRNKLKKMFKEVGKITDLDKIY